MFILPWVAPAVEKPSLFGAVKSLAFCRARQALPTLLIGTFFIMKVHIRPEIKKDIARIRSINTAAFDTTAEADLVDRLRKSDAPLISLVAESKGIIIGHILFSPLELSGNQPPVQLAGLAPMAVSPEYQNRGTGSALLCTGLEHCKSHGYQAVFVLGHPEYYTRFGFGPASAFGIKSEYEVPDEVFMAVELEVGALSECSGVVKYHPEFGQMK